MPENSYSISEIREQITRLPDLFEQTPEAVTVTRHGKPVLAILPWELYEAIMETIEIMLDSRPYSTCTDAISSYQRSTCAREIGVLLKTP